MADWHLPLEDTLAFMGDAERARWDSATQEDRDKMRAELAELWWLIPDPTESQLKGEIPKDHPDLQTYQLGTPEKKERVRSFYVRKWKKERKAEARKTLANASMPQAAEPSDNDILESIDSAPPPREGLQWLAFQLWSWPGISIIATMLYGSGIGAMYGNQPIIAICLYFVGIVLITVRAIAETRTHERRIGTILVILILAAGLLALSLAWTRYTCPQWWGSRPDQRATSPNSDNVRDRPFVIFKLDRLSGPLSPNKRIVVDFIMSNTGSMEAQGELANVTFHWDEKPPFKQWLKRLPSKAVPFKLAPNENWQATIVSPQALPEPIIKAITSGRGRLLVFTKGEYKDSSGRTWPLLFCRIYDKDIGNIVMCPSDIIIE